MSTGIELPAAIAAAVSTNRPELLVPYITAMRTENRTTILRRDLLAVCGLLKTLIEDRERMDRELVGLGGFLERKMDYRQEQLMAVISGQCKRIEFDRDKFHDLVQHTRDVMAGRADKETTIETLVGRQPPTTPG